MFPLHTLNTTSRTKIKTMFINAYYCNIFLIPKYFQQYLKKENKLSCFLPNMKYGAAVYNVVPKNLRLLLHKWWILHILNIFYRHTLFSTGTFRSASGQINLAEMQAQS